MEATKPKFLTNMPAALLVLMLAGLLTYGAVGLVSSITKAHGTDTPQPAKATTPAKTQTPVVAKPAPAPAPTPAPAPAPTATVVSNSYVNLHSAPSIVPGNVIYQVPAGTTVTLEDAGTTSTIQHVSVSGYDGYVLKSYLVY